MSKPRVKEATLQRAKALYRLLFDAAVVTVIYVVSSEHMTSHAYTVGRMVRFWTMWGCASCALYFLVAFSKQLFILFSAEPAPNPSPVFRRVVDAVQHLAVTVCASVTTVFWTLYFKSPSAVLRVDNDWQPSLLEQLLVTHFEHSLPLLFILVDCALFRQGNKHVAAHYALSRFAPLVALAGYTTVVYYDFFCCGIRPYPFMDTWDVTGLTAFLAVFVAVFMGVFNPVAYYLRALL